MGAGQSTDDTGSKPGTITAPPQQSYYDLLAIPHDATTDDIKKAYRKKALELHPDRNYGDVERATALFAEVQAAYEVLSDPQERAWYDSHEDAILNGGDPASGNADDYERNVGLTSTDDITRIISRFNGGVEFNDAPSGFFGFLKDTFEQLAKEEARAAMQQDLEPVDYSSFGHKDDTHEDVKVFYSYWSAFSSRKTFAWKDKYSTRGVGDRRTRRMIEQENKHYRDEARRDFNDAVRALVAFVKKRDPRFKPNTQSEEERQKALRDATRAQAERMRAQNQKRMDEEVLPDWVKMREPDEVEEETEEESEEEQFECVACRKIFKSENQYEAHEKSKKHAKAVQALRRKLQKEGVELDLDEDDVEEDAEGAVEAQSETPPEKNASANDTQPSQQRNTDESISKQAEQLNISEDTSPPDSKPGHNQPQNAETSDSNSNSDVTPEEEPDSDSDSDPDSEQISTPPSSNTPTRDNLNTPESKPQPPKIGKAAQKRARKAAAAESGSAADSSDIQCAVCSASFGSKTKLFDHIRSVGHAAPVGSVKGSGGGGGGGGKKKGKRK